MSLFNLTHPFDIRWGLRILFTPVMHDFFCEYFFIKSIFICEKYIFSERDLNSLSNDYKFGYKFIC